MNEGVIGDIEAVDTLLFEITFWALNLHFPRKMSFCRLSIQTAIFLNTETKHIEKKYKSKEQ